MNRRWDELLRGMVERQRQLENALLRLGQFQHALAELLIWIDKTDGTLDELKPVAGDPQVLEVELAKLKVTISLLLCEFEVKLLYMLLILKFIVRHFFVIYFSTSSL